MYTSFCHVDELMAQTVLEVFVARMRRREKEGRKEALIDESLRRNFLFLE